MLKRPLNPRFTQAVLDGRKYTTIRSKPWPCWKPLMLYNWSGAAYRSPQIDVAAIEVEEVLDLQVAHDPDGGVVFSRAHIDGKPIHESEGFEDAGQMQEWFAKKVRVGKSASLYLMRFRLAKADILGLNAPSAVTNLPAPQPTKPLPGNFEPMQDPACAQCLSSGPDYCPIHAV